MGLRPIPNPPCARLRKDCGEKERWVLNVIAPKLGVKLKLRLTVLFSLVLGRRLPNGKDSPGGRRGGPGRIGGRAVGTPRGRGRENRDVSTGAGITLCAGL